MAKLSSTQRLYNKLLNQLNKSAKQAAMTYGINIKDYAVKPAKRANARSIKKIQALTSRLKGEVEAIKKTTGYNKSRKNRQNAHNEHKYDVNKQGYKKYFSTRSTPSLANEKLYEAKSQGYKSSIRQTPPNLSDNVLKVFEAEMNNAAYMYRHPRGNAKWEEAVHDAGRTAIESFDSNIMQWVTKQLSEKVIRQEVAENLYSNFHINYDDLERYLYQFESNGTGTLTHIDNEGEYRLVKLLSVAFNIDISTYIPDDEYEDPMRGDDNE